MDGKSNRTVRPTPSITVTVAVDRDRIEKDRERRASCSWNRSGGRRAIEDPYQSPVESDQSPRGARDLNLSVWTCDGGKRCGESRQLVI